MMKIAMSVAASMPPRTVAPRICRELAPAPVEITRGRTPRMKAKAVMRMGRIRLRPILMTAFAFILGVLPLVISTGAGANSRQILGATVLGGMLAATLIAIFIIPVTFYVSERFRGESEEAPR